jgi:hypothetical protein
MKDEECQQCGSKEEFWNHICPVYFRCDVRKRDEKI